MRLDASISTTLTGSILASDAAMREGGGMAKVTAIESLYSAVFRPSDARLSSRITPAWRHHK